MANPEFIDKDLFEEANNYLVEGSFEKAIQLYEEYINQNNSSDKLKNIGMAYHNMGVSYDNLRKYDLAIECFIKALDYHKKIDNFRGMSWECFSIGLIFGQLNKFQEMLDYGKKAIDFGTKAKDNEILLKSYNLLAHAYNELKDYSESLKYLSTALKIAFILNDSFYLSETYYIRGISLENLNMRTEAIESYSLAIDNGAKSGNERIVALAFSKLSEYQA